MNLAHFKHILETKGPVHAFERVGQILWRFSFGRRRFEKMLESLETEWDSQAKISFCVTAGLLKRHTDLIGRLHAMGHEIAAHGLYHSRMSILDAADQRSVLEQSHRVFRQAGIPVDGFRCPYLNFNQDTLSALQESPYNWTSQHLVFWENGFNNHLKRLFSIYHSSMSHNDLCLPRRVGRLLEIPITAPDDEMFVERYRVREGEQMTQIWLDIFKQTQRRGELVHLLFHPERYFMVRDSLLAVIRQARRLGPAVWIATLGELADWWQARGNAVWRTEGQGDAQQAWIDTPTEAVVTLEVKPSGDQGQWTAVAPTAQRGCSRAYPLLLDGRRLTLGLSPEAAAEAEEFLVGEGFFVERSQDPQGHWLHLDGLEQFDPDDRLALLDRIEESSAPMLRLQRWPRGAASSLAISSDIDSVTLMDFWERSLHFKNSRETEQ